MLRFRFDSMHYCVGHDNNIQMFLIYYVVFLACSMTCQNGGTLNTETCTCKCMAGYSGANCESNKTACEWSKNYAMFNYYISIHPSQLYKQI